MGLRHIVVVNDSNEVITTYKTRIIQFKFVKLVISLILEYTVKQCFV